MKINKSYIYGIFTGILLSGGLYITASTNFLSSAVSYTSSKTDKTTVKDAFDELYDISFTKKKNLIDALNSKGL